ncbi:DUF3231 family protein [Halalkalibacter urbisdiaboli]|uniref:DUF3231 family protein n=1 Tax=Halalkalibacter urbisdiaboli TaxID=1960589 RepID=UPI000B441F56|nr:DUF3231 family protein [Halalkalibacter urbisdiaboli]
MENHHIRLTSSEVGNLWVNYLNDSMAICVLTYYLAHVEDTKIKKVLEHALDLSKQHVDVIKEIFKEEKIAIPHGFTDEDVNLHAPRLFSDEFMLLYTKHMTKGGLSGYAAVLPNTFRDDIREFYMSAISSTMELFNDATKLLLSKGLEVRAPYVPYPEQVEFVKRESFLTGWFGKQRPLSAVEIAHLYANIQTNQMGKAMTTAFAQTAQSKEIRNHIIRGNEICTKHIAIFSKHLQESNLPVPTTWDAEVHPTKKGPFSDKLMNYHIGVLSSTGMGNYGTAMSLSPRRDLTTEYSRLLAEVGLYAEDGLEITIKHQWLEQPPQAADRKELMKQ